MEIKYLLDTNTVIYYLQEQMSVKALSLIDNLLNKAHINISVITEIELLCWRTEKPEELKIICDFINNSNVFNIDKNIVAQTVNIRKSYKTKLPDAIIAATAITHNLSLITNNTKDFGNINYLTVINPFIL